MLLQVDENTLQVPAAADVMADDGMEHVGSVRARRCAFPNKLFDFIDAVAAAMTVKTISVGQYLFLCSSSFAPLSPSQRQSEHLIDVLQLTNGPVNRAASDGQCFVSPSKQLNGDVLVVDLQGELAIERLSISETPDANPF